MPFPHLSCNLRNTLPLSRRHDDDFLKDLLHSYCRFEGCFERLCKNSENDLCEIKIVGAIL
jgi:hypothetical protein